MSLDTARKNLHGFLDDIAGLKPFLDAEDNADFVAAFEAARVKAKAAARSYLAELNALDGGAS